jgi:hypothetical protein
MPDTMIERMGRAWLEREWPHKIWDGLTFDEEATVRMNVRAILHAMREPTEAMKRAGLDAAGGDGSCLDAYEAMIDAAIAEGE